MPTKHGRFVSWFFVPFRLICDISAKQVGIVRKWSYFKAKLSFNQTYEYKQCSTSNGDNILDRIHGGDSGWGMGGGGSIR